MIFCALSLIRTSQNPTRPTGFFEKDKWWKNSHTYIQKTETLSIIGLLKKPIPLSELPNPDPFIISLSQWSRIIFLTPFLRPFSPVIYLSPSTTSIWNRRPRRREPGEYTPSGVSVETHLSLILDQNCANKIYRYFTDRIYKTSVTLYSLTFLLLHSPDFYL